MMMAYPFKKMPGNSWLNRKIPSNQDIIIEWLKIQPNRSLIKSSDIQNSIKSYAKTMYSKMVNPSTFDRLWRSIRQNNVLDGTGLHVEEIQTQTNQQEKAWLLTKDM